MMGEMVNYLPHVTVRMAEKSIDCGDLWFDQANTCLIQFYKKQLVYFYKKCNVEPSEPDISEENFIEVSRDNCHNMFDKLCNRMYLENCIMKKCGRMFSGKSVWISLTN